MLTAAYHVARTSSVLVIIVVGRILRRCLEEFGEGVLLEWG